MRPILGIAIIVVWFLIALTSAARAESVYLRDGGRVDCESFWRKGDLVVVKVNRDVVVEFGTGEVDLKKTMRVHKQKTGRYLQQKARAVKQSDRSPETAAPDKPASVDKPAALAASAPPASQGNATASKPLSPAAADQGGTGVQAGTTPPKPATPAPEPTVKEKAQPAAAAIPAAMGLMAMGSTMMFLFVGGILAFAVLMIAAQWKVFEKAGVAGWKCLIPIYNMYVLFLISGKPGWWLILMLVPIVSVVVYLLAMLSLAAKFSKGPAYGVGLFILPIIFFPMLAFDSSEYSG